MDLISREAVIEALEFERDFLETPERINGVEDAIEAAQQLPSVAAVPLDKLCEWLGKFANPCKIGIRCHIDYDCMPTVECWRYVLTKWMEKTKE